MERTLAHALVRASVTSQGRTPGPAGFGGRLHCPTPPGETAGAAAAGSGATADRRDWGAAAWGAGAAGGAIGGAGTGGGGGWWLRRGIARLRALCVSAAALCPFAGTAGLLQRSLALPAVALPGILQRHFLRV